MSETPDYFSLPLVSVIIDNYNLGRFVRDAVESVLAQTYPNIECIVVDDASTDDSSHILDEIAAAHPTVKIIRRKVNGDQLATCLDGFAASHGDYVLFLDSDDALLEHCIATHVFVHLSLRTPVGFTCSDLLQVTKSGIVLGGNVAMSDYIVNCEPSKAAVRPALAATIRDWAMSLDQSVLDRIYNVGMSCRTWPWTSTSGFFFRRDALNLWVDTPKLAQMRRSVDGFFGRAVNAVTGSVLIDEALGMLRIHGTNNFTKCAQINNLRSYDLTNEKETQHRHLILDELTRDPARFPFYSFDLWRQALLAADTVDQTLDAPAWARGSRLSYLLVKRFTSLASVFREQDLVAWIGKRGIPLSVLRSSVSDCTLNVSGVKYWFAGRLPTRIGRILTDV
jgi:hypothetical protein